MIKKGLFFLLLGLILCFPFSAGAEGKNIIKIGDDITIEEGNRVNHVIAIGGQVTLYGVADGNVVSVGDSVVLACMKRGFLINCIQDKILRFIPPLIVEKDAIDALVESLDEVLKKG